MIDEPGERPVFVLSTGRSGTLFLQRLLERSADVESFHRLRPRSSRYRNDLSIVEEQNFTFHRVIARQNPSAALRGYALSSLRRSRRRLIDRVHGDGRAFVELNHGFAPFAPLLPEAFPDAAFVHLVRHPRDVVVSFLRKFDPPPMKLPGHASPRFSPRAQWSYRHPRLRSLSEHLPTPVRDVVSDRRYDPHLRPFIRSGPALRERMDLDAFEKTCWYWNEVNRLAADLVDQMGPARAMRVRFEDFFEPDASSLHEELLRFLSVRDLTASDVRALLDEPVNTKEVVSDFPRARDWPPELNEILLSRCGATMARLGYPSRERSLPARGSAG